MKKTEWTDNNPLCCCEYLNNRQERSHILLCCCECEDLDASFDSLITGRQVPHHRRSGLMATLQDRLRIPWRGGAKRITADTILPVILIPILLFIAAIDITLTLIVFFLIPIFLRHAFIWFRSNHPKSKFFVVWAITSFLALAVVFEVKVIALLEILPEENIALGVLTALCFICVYYTRSRLFKSNLVADENVKLEDGFCATCKRKMTERTYHCTICQLCVSERHYHLLWLDCCIGQVNNCLFILSSIFAIAALLYSSNLTLTTICHPFIVYETIMLPDDCSEVYEQYDMAVCFVCAIYSILLAIYLLWILIRQILIVSLGMTGHEWRQLSFSSQLCCGFGSSRPYSKGCFKNWLRLCCNREKNNTYIDT